MGSGTFPDQGVAAPADAGAGSGPRIGGDGTRYHGGAPIRRAALARLFASVLRRDGAGDHRPVTPVERRPVAVDDAPFVAVELRTEDAGGRRRIDQGTNPDVWVAVGPDHPLTVRANAAARAPMPHVALGGRREARLGRPVYHEPAELGEPGRSAAAGRFGVWSRGRFFPLGVVEG